MARSNLGDLFFKILADTTDLASANKDVDKFTNKTKDSAKAINKAAAAADNLSDSEQQAADEAEELHKNAKKVVDEHKKAAKQAQILAEAEAIAADEANNIKKSFTGLGALISGAVAGLSVAAIVGGVKQLATEAKDLENSAKSLGIGVEKLSEYQYAFSRVNISGEKTVDMFKDIADRVGEFANSGGGELTDILARTNLEINELIGLSPDQQLLKIYSALEDIDGITQAEIISYLEQLVSDATLLQPLLADGAAELRSFTEEGKALGATLSQLEVDRLVEVDNEIRELTATFDGLTNDLIIAFAPALSDVAGGLSIFLEAATNSKAEAKRLKEITELGKDSFIDLGKALTDADNSLRAYAGQSLEERKEAKKAIESNILKTKSYIELRKAAANAAFAEAEAIRADKGFFGGFDEKAANRAFEAGRKITGEVTKSLVSLAKQERKLKALGDPSKVPPEPPAPPKTFAQNQAAAEAEKKAAEAAKKQAERDAKTQAAKEKREKDAAARAAERAAAKDARDKKRAANKLKRETEKAQREATRDANAKKREEEKLKRKAESDAKALEREKEQLKKLAEAEQKAAASALDRVQTNLLTKQEQETQSYAQALADLKTAEDAKIATLIPYHELRQRLEKDHQEALETIKNEEQNRDQAQRDIDSTVGGLTGFELEQENAQYQADLEALKVARELELETIASYDEIERAIEQAHQEELLKIKKNADKQAQENQLKAFKLQYGGAEDSVNGMLAVLKAAGQEQSGIYKAMFAASKAFAIAESIIKIQQGVANAAALPFPANLPAIATVLASTANVISTIQSANFSGRQFGGTTSANSGYRINEENVPEVYSQGGKDYLLTGSQRGKVTPLEPASKTASTANSGELKITVNVDGQPQQEIMTRRDVESIALDVVTNKAGEVIAQDFSDANSKASKGLKDNYKVSANLG